MTYTKAMYGMPPTKPGTNDGWYQASKKPAGAQAAQCALERTRADVHEWREQELAARVDDIKRRMAKHPAKKTGPATRMVLHGVGLGALVDREDEDAYAEALRSMPNYEPLDKKQRARLYEATHYPFHTKESAQAFDEDRARRQEQRDKDAAYRYFDDAASRSEYEGTRDRKFETSSERESRILHFRLNEYARIIKPAETKHKALRDIDPHSDKCRLALAQLRELDESLDGPALFATLAKDGDPDPYDLAGKLGFISPDYHLRGRLEDFDMYTKPKYIHYCPMEEKKQEINLFKGIFARYHEGEQLSDHELKLYALALEYEMDEHEERTDIATDTHCAVEPSSDSIDSSSDNPPKEATSTAISRHRAILCFEVRRFVGDEYEAMCRKADLDERHANIRRRIIAAHNKSAQSKLKFKVKNWRRLLPKTSVKEIGSEGFSVHSSIPSHEVNQVTLVDRGIDNYKPFPLISPEKNKSTEVADDELSFNEKGQTSEGDHETISPAMENAPETVEEAEDDFSFDKDKTSEIDVETTSPIIENASEVGAETDAFTVENFFETLQAASLHEGKHSNKAVEDWLRTC